MQENVIIYEGCIPSSYVNVIRRKFIKTHKNAIAYYRRKPIHKTNLNPEPLTLTINTLTQFTVRDSKKGYNI